ncbi:hypothetical protein BC937DRAFT_94132 [Endogone sp. FLAS-F59071]|nr:hypothetical protein BC937DRAFT_94132 [Endogone sp. FLAS-F59071]|eukprot:RUS14242.1 hypothetical protein BC937DRAFT_94132 [Endogone sp. FLAS-F59071]
MQDWNPHSSDASSRQSQVTVVIANLTITGGQIERTHDRRSLFMSKRDHKMRLDLGGHVKRTGLSQPKRMYPGPPMLPHTSRPKLATRETTLPDLNPPTPTFPEPFC